MALFVALGGFFSASQSERLVEALVVALVTLLSLVPVLVAVVQLKMARQIREIRQNQEVYSEKIETISRRSDSAAREGEPVAPDPVRELREEGLVGRDRETGDFPERRRNAPQPLVQPEEVNRDESSGS
jgi:hypothetical protein